MSVDLQNNNVYEKPIKSNISTNSKQIHEQVIHILSPQNLGNSENTEIIQKTDNNNKLIDSNLKNSELFLNNQKASINKFNNSSTTANGNKTKIQLPKIFKNEKLVINENGLEMEETLIIGDSEDEEDNFRQD
jgi:hypothetical protein